MRTETLGFLTAQLQTRLGFGAMGSAAAVNTALIRHHLFLSQKQIYERHDWKHLKEWGDMTLGASQRFIDYPDNANTERILDIRVFEGGQLLPMDAGIDPGRYREDEVETTPDCYACRAQIEVYPIPEKVYTLRLWYIRELGRFLLDDDRTSVDPDLLLLHALANLKAHYRHPDAEALAGQVDNLMTAIKGHSREQRTFARGPQPAPYIKPRVVGRDD